MLLISFLTLFCANENQHHAQPPAPQRREASLCKSSWWVGQFKRKLGLIPTNTAHSESPDQQNEKVRKAAETMGEILCGRFGPWRD